MDLIERQKAIDAVKDADVCVFYSDNHSIDDVLDYMIRATKGSVIASIEQLSSTQPEIIRCKDCFYGYCEVWLTGGGEATSHGYCGRTNLRVLPYDFCSKAERRTDETD